MARSYKIKSYKRIYRRSISSIILRWLMILAGLVFLFVLGWKLYEPISEWFHKEPETVIEEQQEELPAAPQSTETAETKPETPAVIVPEEPKQPEAPVEAPVVKPEETAAEPEKPAEEALPPITSPAKQTLYLSKETLLDDEAFAAALSEAKESGMDSVMIDLKSRDGWVVYPIQYKDGFDDYYTAKDTVSLETVAKQIREAGMKPIASIYTFMDRRFQQAETYAGILYGSSDSFWLDNALDAGGKSWLNPYSPLAREYIVKLMSDAAEAGFGEIVLREFRFPVGGSMEQMRFVYDAGQSKQDCLKAADDYFREKAAELNVELWVEYPAEALHGGDSRPYGGDCIELLEDGCIIDLSACGTDSAELADIIASIMQGANAAQLAGMTENDAQTEALQAAGIDHYIRMK